MSKTDVESLPAGSGQDHFPIVIAAMPITARERRFALGVISALAVIDLIVVPFANVKVGRVDAFIPTIQTVMCVVDLVTAALLFAQYSIHPMRAVLAVGAGYVFSGLFAFIQTLAFPGAYSPTGLIGDGINSAAWLFVLWQSTFPAAIMAYTLAKNTSDAFIPSDRSTGTTIAAFIACLLAATAGLTWLAIGGTRYLPALYLDALQQTPFANNINLFLWAINIAALVLLFACRRTILDLWLIVILFAWWLNFLVAISYSVIRFSAGWYIARVAALLASSTLLIVLLAESAALYGRLANAFLLLRRERADRLGSVGAATAAMAHELRQPLTAIATRGAAGLNWLKRTPPELKKVGDCLESMLYASHRAEEVIAGIRGLFKERPNERTMIQINNVIHDVLALCRDDLKLGGITATAEYQEGLPEIFASHAQIQQVILNLVKNAIEALCCGPTGNRRLRLLTGSDGKSSVAVYVQDSGTGIMPNDRDRIFEPFFTTKPGGMGLGLSICRTIVENHGGDLRLSKTDSHGTSFELAFPVGSAHAARTQTLRIDSNKMPNNE